MKKRIFALALALCMLLSVMPTSFAAEGFLTLGGSEPAAEADSQTSTGVLTLGGTEEEDEEPTTGVLIPGGSFVEEEEPADEEQTEEPQPPTGVLYTQCAFCGYLDNTHADDCPTLQPEEEEVVEQPVVQPQQTTQQTQVTQEEITTKQVSNYTAETVSTQSTSGSERLTIQRNAMAYATLSASLMTLSEEDGIAAQADELATDANNGLELSKSVEETTDGYQITLEAYVTGTQVTSTVTTTKPMDIILVLDTSKEMATTTYAYEYVKYDGSYTLSNLYNESKTRALYLKTGDQYVQISIEEEGRGNKKYTYTLSANNKTLYNKRDGNTVYEASTHGPLYVLQQSTTTQVTRLSALQSAANSFINTIADQTFAEDVLPTRIALVKYNSNLDNNVTVLSGTRNETEGALVTVADHASALTGLINNLTVDINAAAYCNYGLAAAKNIFQGVSAANADRDRVVILLSAGVFGSSGTLEPSTDGSNAMDTIWLSSILKMPRAYDARNQQVINGYTYGIDFNSDFYGYGKSNETTFSKYGTNYSGCGATVYCVGLNMPVTTDVWNTTQTKVNVTTAATIPSKINEVMYRVSSHRPDGTHPGFNKYNDWEGMIGDAPANGKASDPWEGTYPDTLTRNVSNLDASYTSYFLTADDAAGLNNIFQTISTDVTTGGANNTTLTETTVVKDVLSPYFQIPDDADAIKVYTADYIGDDSDNITDDDWKKPVEFEAKVENDDGTITVTNFDFSENWVGTSNDTNHGKKLVIVITVKAVSDFLGGNNVPSNVDSEAGIYDAEGNLVENFENTNAYANVPVTVIEPSVQTVNVYLTQAADLEDLFNKDSRINGTNNAYVTITYTVKNGSETCGTYEIEKGKSSGTWVGKEPVLYKDTTYTITCKVDGGGTNVAEVSKNASVHVYKPEVTFQDSTIYLSQTPVYESFKVEGEGDDAVTIQTGNYQSITWKHGSTVASDAMGDAPIVTYDYSPEETAFVTCTDVNVSAQIGNVDITTYVTFTDEREDGYEFTVHVLKPSFEITAPNIWADYAQNVDVDSYVTAAVTDWADATEDHTDIPAAPGDAPTNLTYTYTVKHGEDEVVEYSVGTTNEAFAVELAGFKIGTYDGKTNWFAAPEAKRFTVYVNKFDLTITKEWATGVEDCYKQDVIFTIVNNTTGSALNGQTIQVVIPKGETSVTVVGLLCGQEYDVTEANTEGKNWAWRFERPENQTVAKASHGVTPYNPHKDIKDHVHSVETPFENSSPNTKWFDALANAFNIFNKGGNNE